MLERVKWSIGFLIFVLGFFLSFQLGTNSLSGEIFVDAQEILKQFPRDIAAVKKEINATGPLLLSTAPDKILQNARLTQNSHDRLLKLVLGHFSTMVKSSKSPVFACQAYDNVIISYEAAGQNFHSGGSSPPIMQIETACVMDPEDVLHLKPINFNPQLVIKEPPAEGLKTAEDGSYTLRFENIDTPSWPTHWKFISVQFKDTKNGEAPTIQLEREKIANNQQNKLDISW